MCTVTFLPNPDFTYILTSSRDEKASRPSASAPEIHSGKNQRLLYPIDPAGKGTWIACSERGISASLLNGALVPHISAPPYKHSRGKVLLDLLENYKSVNDFVKNYQFIGIEPFTLVIVWGKKLFEVRWDGKKVYDTELTFEKAHIWSSVTLYNPAAVVRRKEWFENWLQETEPSLKTIRDFHKSAGDGDVTNAIRMNREGNLFTVSITSIVLEVEKLSMVYEDLKNMGEKERWFSFTSDGQ